MTLLRLFFSFFLIGAVSFGGGYGMISVISETVLRNDWLTETEFLNLVAVSESTPGPLAVNMATFVGASQAGLAGALLATLGVVLPSFLIILLIATVLKNLLSSAPASAFLAGVRPCVVAMILSTALTMGLQTLLGIVSFQEQETVSWRPLVIFALLVLLGAGGKRVFGKKLSPILMIAASAALGVALYGFI